MQGLAGGLHHVGSLAGIEPGEIVYASFWRRFAALLIDFVVIELIYFVCEILFLICLHLALPSATVMARNGLIDNGLHLIIVLLYFAGLESSPVQATAGKLAFRIYVTDVPGNRISFGQAVGRILGKFLSALPLFFGFLLVLFTQRRQCLHDFLAGTVVIRGHCSRSISGRRGRMQVVRRSLGFFSGGLSLVYMLAIFILFLIEVYYFLQWWGLLGLIVALVAFPLPLIFPFIYWFMADFSVLLFGIWAFGFSAYILSVILRTIAETGDKDATGVQAPDIVEGWADDADVAISLSSNGEYDTGKVEGLGPKTYVPQGAYATGVTHMDEYKEDVATEEWTEFWTWARKRGFRDRAAVDAFLGMPTENLTPLQLVNRIDAKQRAQS